MSKRWSPRCGRSFGAMLAAALIGGALWTASVLPSTPPAAASAVAEPLPYVPNEVLVQFQPWASIQERDAAFRLAGAVEQDHIYTDAMRTAGSGGIVRARTLGPVPNTLEALQNHPAVEFAEPNWIYTHQAVSDDPYYTGGQLWGMYGDATLPAKQFGSQAGEARANGSTGSATVYVGIIDEGVQYAHVDLDGNAAKNPGETGGKGRKNKESNRIDDDGNGYVDDVRGWDFAGNNNTVYDGSTDDHGTHVTGTIGAEGGNGSGVVGVNWNVRFLVGKFLGPFGGTTANAIKAVDYFTDLKTRHGLNIVATNNSWGGGGFSQGLKDAIQRGADANILFVAAAGNNGSNNDTSPFYPASYDNANVIAVAAITSSGALASFSNYGAAAVDIGAPGSGIWSTVPTHSYNSYSGTSMAGPHVTGAAALYAASHPGATAADIKAAILAAAIPMSSLAGRCVTGGRLDVSGF